MSDTRVPTRAPGAVDAEVDGQRVVLSPRDYQYFVMEGAGAAVWDLIDGHRTVDAILALLETEHEAPSAVIRSETEDYLASLARAGLLVDFPQRRRD